MTDDTLNALIAHHGNALLREAGWPAAVHVHARATTLKPDTLALRGRLSAGQILALVSRLCRGRNDADSGRLTAVAKSLSGTPAELYMTPKFDRPEPRTGAALLYGRLLMSKKDCNSLLAFLADCMEIHLPYAGEWLTQDECADLLAFLKGSADRVCEIVRRDAQRLVAALKPSATPHLTERCIGDWRLLADEYDHDNWLDEDDTERLDEVLDAVLVCGARFCPVLLMLVNERAKDIRGAGVITDRLRFPGDPARRWLDRRVLREVTAEARAMKKAALQR